MRTTALSAFEAYKVHDEKLYKKSATGVLQRCIFEEEGRQLPAEIHAGLGGHHTAAQALLARPSVLGFISRQPEQTRRTLSNGASDASSSPTKATCPNCLTNYPHYLAFRGLGTGYGWTP